MRERKYLEMAVETGRIGKPADTAMKSYRRAFVGQIKKGSGKCSRKCRNYRHCRAEREKRGIISRRELPLEKEDPARGMFRWRIEGGIKGEMGVKQRMEE